MKSFLCTLALLAAAALAQAQPGSTGPTPGSPTAGPTETPLDGGASLLLAGGVALGIRKLRERRKAAQ